MAMEPWDPFNQAMSLRDAMDRLLQESIVRPSAGRRGAETEALALDVRETENEYTLEASLPGVRPEDIQIQVAGDTVTIRAGTRHEREQKAGEHMLMRERRAGTYYRSLTLPMPTDADHVQAHFENGVLRLELPKAEQARPRRIEVHAGMPSPHVESIPIEGTAQEQQAGQAQAETTEGPPIH